jgi:hypothetical protein
VTEIALVLTAVTLVVGISVAFCLRLLPTVRLQLVALALLAVVLPLAAVLASGWVMFHMHDDAKLLAVSSAAALSAVVGALLLGRWVARPSSGSASSRASSPPATSPPRARSRTPRAR